jgi:pimeloyl-ACP methyl ester carboxylesterase
MLGSAATRSGHADAIHHWFELLATRVDGDLLPELIAPFLFGATFQQQRPGVVADIVRAMRPTAAGRELMAAQARALQQFDGEALARACPTPTLCLAGSEDLLTLPADVAATAELLPNAHYRCLPAAGHSLLLESAAAFDAVVDFVRGRAS